MRRREFVVGALGAGLAASNVLDSVIPGAPAAGGVASASQLRTAIPFGAAVRVDYLADQFDYKTAILEHCQMVVGEGGLKWIDLRPTRDDFVFDQPDRLIAFADANGMKMRGHTLAWYGAMPDWTQQIASETEAEGELVRHIEMVVGRYKGRIPSWDVINEAIADHPTPDSPYRDSIWQQRLGKRFVELSLRTAAAVDPDVQLVINDYAIENPTDQCRAKREALLNMLRDLKDRDVPLHAVGIQGHLLGDQEIDKDGLSRFVEAVVGMDLEVLVTELDVIDNKLPASTYDRDQIAAATANDFLRAICDVKRPGAILTWGITDRYTWVPMWFTRDDGKPNRPLPLDVNYRPKALMQVIEEYTRVPA